MTEKNRAIAILTIICVVWLSVGLLACSGRCRHLIEEYEAAIRRETARAGTGFTSIGSGEYHLGMTLSSELLERLLDDANGKLDATYTRLTVGQAGTSRRTAVEVMAQPLLEHLQMQPDSPDEVLVHCRLEARVTIRSLGGRMDYFLIGSFGLVGYLSVIPDERDVPVLELALVRYAEEDLDLGANELPVEIAQAVEAWILPELSQRLFGGVRRLPLARFPPILLGPLYLTLSPAGLVLFPQDDQLFLGFVTNLRPRVGGQIRPSAGASQGGLLVMVHPGLADAAVRLALADGRLPRHFGDEGQPQPDGSIHITLDAVRFLPNTIELTFKLWDARQDHCESSLWTLIDRFRTREGTIAVEIEEFRPRDEADQSSTPVDPERWRNAALAADTTEMMRQLVNLSRLELGLGDRLPLVTNSFEVEERRILIELQPAD